MSSTNDHDGALDSELTAVEMLWRSTANVAPENFLAFCTARVHAELQADRQRRDTLRFYLAAAAVLLIGWHASLLATWSTASPSPGSEIASRSPSSDSRSALLTELTAELNGEQDELGVSSRR
jgi:hypothetical protein